ncbi:hypothetical protein MJO28_005971 [Puccinia striiformis f. sp. tritici]|uniref:Uncharacterized protein n=2 Tax=Puccinia striiformis TaxID=27350 RepID=A0A2S4V6F9_9BASI|nr:hypothetical protein Pst134EA_011203 [Puccinia striiformis f. sp. tritici]KAH9467562.1 hypothetical protein Pst134EA_011203 [Puccinia striiformis f. sp. tritici]KAI7953424.1 hypothetical protein MJO28_005971 [Puccinia striiformis f. sp. tritici]KAI9604814.1 hypothetical protein H4Q26_002784 [Puccinia striiformis f. sp. tritici PST-130]POW05094.1 hypothetical protein PSTT_09959 [Puccinia striiformis]
MTTNQLTRRTNNTQNRKLADTTNKRPISALKIDQNQPFKKIKPTSPHQLHSTPLNLIRKCPAPPSPIPQRTPIHLNVTRFNALKPSTEKKNDEKNFKVNDRKQVPWKSNLNDLRSNLTSTESQGSHGLPPKVKKTVPIAQPAGRIEPPKAMRKPIHSYQVTTPLKKVLIPKREETHRSCDHSLVGLELIRASKPMVVQPTRPLIPINTAHSSLTAIPVPKTHQPTSPLVSPNKKQKKNNLCLSIDGSSFNRAQQLIEINQSSLRMWQSDLDAGVLKLKNKKFIVIKVCKDKSGSQVAHCLPLEQQPITITTVSPPSSSFTVGQQDSPLTPTQKIWKLFLRGPDCKINDRLKIFEPWSELNPNIIISNKFISF